MISNDDISTQIEKLSKIKSSLVKERKEYIKYHDYFESSINSLFESNTKLLNSFKERYTTYIILMKRHNSIDISLNDQIKIVKNREKMMNSIRQVSKCKNEATKQVLTPKEAIDAIIRLVKHELKDLYSRLQLIRQQNLYEEKFLSEIKELKKKKEKLEDQKRLYEKDIDFLQKQFSAISQYNDCEQLISLLEKLNKSISICQNLRQDKLNIINFHQQMERNQKYHCKIKGVDPESLLMAFDLSLSSNVSTANLSSLCQSTDDNRSKNDQKDSHKQVASLTTSTEKMSLTSSYKLNYDDSSLVGDLKSNEKVQTANKSSDIMKSGHSLNTQSSKSKSPKLDKKRARIVNDIIAGSQKGDQKTAKDQKKIKNSKILSSSEYTQSKESEYKDYDYYSESAFSSTTSHQKLSSKSNGKDSIKKNQKSSSNSMQNEKKSDLSQTKKDSSKNNSESNNNQKNNSESNNNQKNSNESNESDASSMKSDNKKETSSNIKNDNDMQVSNYSEIKMASVRSFEVLSSVSYATDGTRHRHYSSKRTPLRIPVISPDKCDLFVHLLYNHHKKRVNQIRDNGNIHLSQQNISSLDLSSSQAFYNEFRDSNEFGSFLRKNNELAIEEFDTFTQTDESFRTILASILNSKLQRFINEDKINDSVFKSSCQLDELETDLSALKRELEMKSKKREKWLKSFKIVPPEKLNKLELNIKRDVEKANSKSQTNQIQSLEKIRNEIIENSKLNPKSFLKKMEHRDLVAMLTKKKLELKIIKMTNVRKQLDINSLLKRLKIVDPLMYSAETHEPAQIEVDRNILDKKQQKLDKIESINRHYNDIVSEGQMLSDQIADQEYLVESITNYLTDMAKEPKSNVRALCNALKHDRSSINEINRQISFITIENESISKEINRYDEIVSSRNLMLMSQKVENLYKYLVQLKSRFNTLRAVKENRSFVMTFEGEMVSLQRQINMVLSEIEVYRMRINGTISKIEKQIRNITLKDVRCPKPISNFTRNEKSKSPHKYSLKK